MKRLFRHLSLLMVLALLAIGIMGCGSKDVEDALNLANEVVSILTDTEAEDALSTTEASDTEIISTEADSTEAASTEAEVTDAGGSQEEESATLSTESTLATLDEDGSYNSRDEVALYIHLYGKLPSNYLTKKEAQALGWSGGSLEPYAPGCSIGGSYFGNNEGLLPKGSYTECDIDTVGKKSRGAKRIVFSSTGEIYYTEDHYESFTLLYTADGPVTEEIIYD